MDLDNTLVFAADWHYEALNEALFSVARIVINRDDHEKIYNGLSTKTKLKMLRENNKLTNDQSNLVWELKQQFTISVINKRATIDYEKIKMHQYIRSSGYKLACVTNSIRETAELMLKKTGQFEYMDLLISNEDVKNNKPNSECYVCAMVMLNSKPNETLIVEDAEPGLIAARATGAYVWQIKNPDDVNLNNLKERLSLC